MSIKYLDEVAVAESTAMVNSDTECNVMAEDEDGKFS
jgi:hypothetical protein